MLDNTGCTIAGWFGVSLPQPANQPLKPNSKKNPSMRLLKDRVCIV
jgi:hypothetical protein